MPRPRAIKDSEIVDVPLPGTEGLEPDPQPGAARRPPGRPRGSRTNPAKKGIVNRSATTGKAMSKAQLKAHVANELYAFASMFVGLIGMKDPVCTQVLTEDVALPEGGTQERLAAIVDRTVTLLARSDKALSTLATTGVIGEVVMLGSLLVPVARQVWHAHGPNGIGHKEEENLDDIQGRYPAPALA